MSGKAPLRRFLLLVLLPAIVTCIGVVRTADNARHEHRDAVLSRAGNMLSTAVQSDLAEAWRLLEAEAAPVGAVDTTIAAIRRARSGDTVRALGTDPAGPRASVLFPLDDTLVSATAVFRSPIIAAAPEYAPLDVALYLQGVRLQPPIRGDGARVAAIDAGDGLPAAIDPTPGWSDTSQVWVHPATASLGSAMSDLVVGLRPVERRRSSTSLPTLLSATLLLLLSLGFVATSGRKKSGTRAERKKLRGRVVAGVTLATLTTAVVSISVALGAERCAVVDGARELEVIAGLVEARGLMNDPAAAQRWTGSPVYAVRAGEAVGGSDAPIPAIVTELRPPEADRPTTGEAQVHWRAVATPVGYTVFLGDPVRMPPLLLLALGGTVVTLLGAVAVARVR